MRLSLAHPRQRVEPCLPLPSALAERANGAYLAQRKDMLLEGTCEGGHELVCVMEYGRLSGVSTDGELTENCPICGGKPYLLYESGTVAVASSAAEDAAIPVQVRAVK
jgi:hypothetical protein